jgi:plasmid stability protein
MENHEPPMSSVTIRNIDPVVKEQLRLRAARHGRSMEAELRAIVSAAVQEEDAAPTPNLAEAIRRRFAPLGGVELDPHPPVTSSAPPTFEP